LNELKKAVCAAIDANRDRILSIGEDILHHPELGYKEKRTGELVEREFRKLGLVSITRPALTGVKGWARGRSHSASVALIGELDAVLSPSHPFAEPSTGAAHACGHNTQIAAMLGCAQALISTGIINQLDGDVCFFATPAEEYVELAYRQELIHEGKISWLGGKQELISEGAFDDIDMAVMTHSETDSPVPRIVVGGNAMGFIGKTIRFIGKEAHAGGAPEKGINALNAAALAIMAINSQRETFRDCDSVRVHPIITKGGDLVNIVPADVRMESYVRANTVEAMQGANRKVNRAIRGASYAIGAQSEINDMAGYLPLRQSHALTDLAAANAAELIGEDHVFHGLPFAGSTDMGDLGYVIPVIQPTVSGFSGAAHSCEFTISNPEYAYIIPAKLMAMTAIDLLEQGAAKASEVKQSFKRKSSAEYRAVWENILHASINEKIPGPSSQNGETH